MFYICSQIFVMPFCKFKIDLNTLLQELLDVQGNFGNDQIYNTFLFFMNKSYNINVIIIL